MTEKRVGCKEKFFKAYNNQTFNDSWYLMKTINRYDKFLLFPFFKGINNGRRFWSFYSIVNIL
ncbi:MAG: hypothetical protein CME63_14750 [Halobacteriovoraceae bacterium]|nr:hypothetical protein [Halobacteriovoraceae bacterium]